MSAARCPEHAYSRRIHDDCGPCADRRWAAEVAPFAKPSESLASFKVRWRRHMFGFVGLTPRAAMPKTLTDAQWTVAYRASIRTRLAVPSADSRRDLGAWTDAVNRYECAMWEREALARPLPVGTLAA
jgi:hypothetical protein